MINYIFCISLLIGSASWLCDLYIKIDHKAHQEYLSFKLKTQSSLKDFNLKNDGFGTLLGITLVCLFSLIFYFFLLKLKIEQNEIQNRKQTYACFYAYNRSLKKYIAEISKINMAQKVLFTGKASGILAPEAETISQGLIILSNAIHFSFMKNIYSNNDCSPQLKSALIFKHPYQLQSLFILKRSFDRNTILKEPTWSIDFINLSLGIRRKQIFSIHANYSLTSVLKGKIQISAEEMGLSKLNLPSGSVSWFSSL